MIRENEEDEHERGQQISARRPWPRNAGFLEAVRNVHDQPSKAPQEPRSEAFHRPERSRAAFPGLVRVLKTTGSSVRD